MNAAVGNCAQKIRQIAGVYQSGGNLKDAKCSVDLALSELGYLNRKQPELQIINWEQLRLSLQAYLNYCSDIRWLTVIKYARAKAGSRRAGVSSQSEKKGCPILNECRARLPPGAVPSSFTLYSAARADLNLKGPV